MGCVLVDSCFAVFPYERSLVLNALYDTLESMGLKIEQVNSERGTVIARSTELLSRSIRIACNGVPLEEKSKVILFPDIEDAAGEQLSKIILEEINATIQRSRVNEKSKSQNF